MKKSNNNFSFDNYINKNHINFLKYITFYFLIFSILKFETLSLQSKTKKNILVTIFPGGKSHHFVMKELFDYSLQNQQNF